MLRISECFDLTEKLYPLYVFLCLIYRPDIKAQCGSFNDLLLCDFYRKFREIQATTKYSNTYNYFVFYSNRQMALVKCKLSSDVFVAFSYEIFVKSKKRHIYNFNQIIFYVHSVCQVLDRSKDYWQPKSFTISHCFGVIFRINMKSYHFYYHGLNDEIPHNMNSVVMTQ